MIPWQGFFIVTAFLLWLAFVGFAFTVPLYAAMRALRRLRARRATAVDVRRHLRASDRERALVVEALRDGFATGRLSLAELEARSAEVWTARTVGRVEYAARGLPRFAPEAAARRIRPWLRIASVYNLLWSLVAFAAPVPLGWKMTGLVLLAYAAGYRWAARDPLRDAHLVAVGLIGKTLGPLAFLVGLATGAVAPPFGLLILANDVVWWPAFFRFVRAAARAEGGWRSFAS